MKMIIKYSFLLSLLVVFYTEVAVAQTERWWQKEADGWFFFKEKPKTQEDPQIEEPTKEPIKEEPKEPEKKKLYIEWISEEGKRLLSEALEKPTLENVKRYMEFNKLSYELSEDFALTWQKVLMQYPHLNPERPTNDNLLREYFAQDYKRQEIVLRELSQKIGLFYFYSSTCSYCQQQNEFIKAFKRNHPYFVIKSISVNGNIIHDLPDSVADNGIGEYLGVRSVPAIFIGTPPDKFQMLYSGVITDDDIKKALLYYATEVPIDRNNKFNELFTQPARNQ